MGIKEKHLRQAIDNCLKLPDWYDQAEWGSDCRSPRCVWGEAAVLAGVTPGPPESTGHDAGRYGDAIAELALCPHPGVLRLMAAVQEDGSIPEEVLADVARTARVWRVRQIVVRYLTDQYTLAQIAQNDVCWQVRRTAVFRLTDTFVLSEIASEDKSANVRRAAVDRLTAEIKRLKRWVPRPEDMSGWNDPGAPKELLRDVAEACRIHGVPMPPHVAEAEALFEEDPQRDS